MATAISVQNFKGWRDDSDAKQIPADYLYKLINFDFGNGNDELKKILMPERIRQITDRSIDGFTEFRYLDKDNVLHNEQIFVSGGQIFVCDDIEFFKSTEIKNGLEEGICTFAVHNDKLYIANGKNYPQIYNGNVCTEMGAPFAELQETESPSQMDGYYTYQVTYLYQTGTDEDGNPVYGNEEVLGSKSNPILIINDSVRLTIPIGYGQVAARNLYRNTRDNPDEFVLLHQFQDNTTTDWVDNLSDAAIHPGVIIPEVNNELPKPKYLQVANQILFGCGDVTLPTQMFNTDTELTIFDRARFIDVSNYGNDNSPLKGLGYDYNQLVTGTDNNIIFVNPSPNIDDVGNLSFAVNYTRANVGILDGHSLQRVSAFGNFPGGLMFVSTTRDVRLIVGNQAITLTTLDNISTDNYSQVISGTLPDALSSYETLCSTFFDYKYFLCVDGTKYVFNIRTQGWTKHNIDNGNVRSNPVFLGVMNNRLYNGQLDGYIEAEYSDISYLGEEIPAYIESPQMFVDTKYKMITTMKMWFSGSTDNQIEAKVYIDDNKKPIEADFSIEEGAFDRDFFRDNFYYLDSPLDYKNFNINYNAKWMRYCIKAKGTCTFHAFNIFAEI